MTDTKSVFGNLRQNRSDVLVAIGAIAIVMMMIIPLPAVLLDVFMAANVVLALLIILTTLYTRNALEFSVFPTLLLVSTVFGLALNISATRLILVKGSGFNGQIVRAFATFVVGTSGIEGYVIGLIIFVIIIAMQVIVITKGTTRIAEVAARFTLDALPGKQMAVEAEYNSGLITEEEATRKKGAIQREADFYGAMDGASKFVSGNVKLAILITVFQIVAGLIVGMTLHGETWDVAFATYISLAIGDGLVMQLPALLISTATGIIVTRAISDSSFGKDISRQFSSQSRPYLISAAFLGVLSFLPGFPWYVTLPMGGLIAALGFSLNRKQVVEEEKTRAKEAVERDKAAPAEISPIVPLDPLSLEIGYGLIPLVDKEQGAELLDRITRIRRESALELGLVVPRIRIIDNMRLEPSEYSFKIRGVEVGRGKIKMGHYLAIQPGTTAEELAGEPAKDPAFGLPAVWITEDEREHAERLGYTVVDPPSIIATHLTEIIKRHAADIVGRQEVQSILDTLKNDYPAVVDEVKKTLSIGEIQKVLQGLLMERVSVRNMVAILETLADYAGATKDIGFLTEKVRQALGRQICLQYCDEKKVLHVLTLEPSLEKKIIESRVETNRGIAAGLDPALHRKWINALVNSVRAVQEQGKHEVILCSEAARPLVKSSTMREVPHLAVISSLEIAPDVNVESLGEVRLTPVQDEAAVSMAER
jgi:flagellar biosynthesis protein FlhA